MESRLRRAAIASAAVLAVLAVAAPIGSAATIFYTLLADMNGWRDTAGGVNPPLTAMSTDTVSVTIEWVNSIHNFAVYPGGTPPSEVDIGGAGALVRSATVTTSLRRTTVSFQLPPGTYEYYCEYHPFSMHGVLTVTGAEPIRVALTAPWTQLAFGQTMSVTAKAEASGAAVSGASVTVTTTSGLTATLASPTTGADGTVTMTVQAIGVGSQSLTVSASKSGLSTGLATLAISVIDPPLPLTMGLSSDTTEMMSYERATIQVHLTNTNTGGAVTGGQITPVSPGGGNLSAATELGGGIYVFGWDAPLVSVQTFVSISVTAKVGGYTDARGRDAILVDPNMTNRDQQLFLIVQPAKTVLTSNEQITVTVFVFTIQGFVVRGSTVTLRMLVPIGTLSGVTDLLNGVYTFTYTAPTVTSATGVSMRIDASKLGYNAGSIRLGLQILP